MNSVLEFTIAYCVISEPVPKHVGIQTRGFSSGNLSYLTMYSTPQSPMLIALEASIGEPPPIAMIRLMFLSLYAAIQASTVSIDGFGSMSSKMKY